MTFQCISHFVSEVSNKNKDLQQTAKVARKKKTGIHK